MQILTPAVAQAKTLITSSDEAKAMGRWDAEHGQRLDTSRYAFADENSIAGSRMSGDYTFAYITAKGL
jgi:hypothetical protein